MTRVAERIELNIDGQVVIVERLTDGTFRKPDYLAGAEREVVGKYNRPDGTDRDYSDWKINSGEWKEKSGFDPSKRNITAPATLEAQTWDGYGTALKPAWEPIIVAMKPLDGTFAENALRWGVAGLNIDGARVPASKEDIEAARVPQPIFNSPTGQIYNFKTGTGRNRVTHDMSSGRWPANLLHDGSDEVLALFPVTGNTYRERKAIAGNKRFGDVYRDYEAQYDTNGGGYSDSGSAARFFYCAKASKSERDAGLDDYEEQQWVQWQTSNGASGKPSSMSADRNTKRRNIHPTVKPLALMEYLCTLTRTPTGGVVLDPFMGSGSTGVAALGTGRSFIGIEEVPTYFDIARARIEQAQAQMVMEL